MKKILFILGIFLVINLNSQVFEITDVYFCKKEREIKRIQKRFDRAVIGKDYFGEPGNYYMELEEDDIYEYYKLFKFKIYCIPKKKRKKIQLIMLFYDEGDWSDEQKLFNNEKENNIGNIIITH